MAQPLLPPSSASLPNAWLLHPPVPKYPVSRVGWGARLGLSGRSTHAAVVLRPAAPHGCQQRGGSPGGGHSTSLGDIRIQRDLVRCCQAPDIPQRAVNSCWLHSKSLQVFLSSTRVVFLQAPPNPTKTLFQPHALLQHDPVLLPPNPGSQEVLAWLPRPAWDAGASLDVLHQLIPAWELVPVWVLNVSPDANASPVPVQLLNTSLGANSSLGV